MLLLAAAGSNKALTPHLSQYGMRHSALSLPMKLEVMMCRGDFIAAKELMLSSEARIHFGYSAFDGILYGPVIAGCKMEEGYFFKAAPVAPVERACLVVEQRHSEPSSHLLRHCKCASMHEVFSQQMEECVIEKRDYSTSHVLLPGSPVKCA